MSKGRAGQRGAGGDKIPPHIQKREAGRMIVENHALLGSLMSLCFLSEDEHHQKVSPDGWAAISSGGTIYVNPKRHGSPEEWAWVFAHLLLHLGFGHFPHEARKGIWQGICDGVVQQFLQALKVGHRPSDVAGLAYELGSGSEKSLYQRFLLEGLPVQLQNLGCAGSFPDMIDDGYQYRQYNYGWGNRSKTWTDAFAEGLRNAVKRAVDVASGDLSPAGSEARTVGEKARRWFMSNYPLLGALATAFRVVEDRIICQRMDIQVAAVHENSREIYFNPQAQLNEEEARFVMAHELLHVALRHDSRRQGRDAYLWNVACDFAINLWLLEMRVGKPPKIGILLDDTLRGISAENIYDRIVNDIRLYRRLATLRGTGLGDILPMTLPPDVIGKQHDTQSLDAFCRQAIAHGLLQHQQQNRGLLPAGLIEDIWAVAEPPIPWDVALARLFDAWFPPLEARRTYARPSRRQSSTPDIPRPRFAFLDEEREGRTFAVILDTSGSMMRSLLGQALGAISSYALARDVAAVRLIFCDATPYDAGYVAPEALLSRVAVQGRGGTVLQPAVEFICNAVDFPPDGPILLITDGQCDVLHVPRPHAYLLPQGCRLPFPPKGDVFYVS